MTAMNDFSWSSPCTHAFSFYGSSLSYRLDSRSRQKNFTYLIGLSKESLKICDFHFADGLCFLFACSGAIFIDLMALKFQNVLIKFTLAAVQSDSSRFQLLHTLFQMLVMVFLFASKYTRTSSIKCRIL